MHWAGRPAHARLAEQRAAQVVGGRGAVINVVVVVRVFASGVVLWLADGQRVRCDVHNAAGAT